jgi:hypothetical protein
MEEKETDLTDGEETIVAPRFDDEETVLARPVVPFEEVGPDAAPAASHAGMRRPPLRERLRGAPRRSLVVTLVLISALAGSVLGGAGLYLYQQHRNTDEAPAATQPQQAGQSRQADAPQPDSQPSPQAPAVQQPASQPRPQAPEPAAAEETRQHETVAAARPVEEERAAPAARRDDSEEDSPAVAPKRGKKGDRDGEPQRASRRRDHDEDEQLSRGDDGEAPSARRVGTITYRPRRARQRRDSYGDADRLRRIFEGQP